MMRSVFGFLLLCSLLGLSACGDSEEDKDVDNGTITINFKAVYDGQPIVMNEEEYTYFNDKELKFSRLNLVLSEPTLTGESNDQELSDVIYVDFGEKNRTLEGAQEGVAVTYELPVGSYDQMNFGIGLTPEQNSKIPSDYPSDHPLQEFAGYWTAWKSFIFSRTEGRYDTNQNGGFDGRFVYHIGSDQMYRNLSITGDFSIQAGSNSEWDIIIDYKRVLGETTQFIDIEQYPAFHSPQDPTLTALTNQLSDNFQAAFTVVKN